MEITANRNVSPAGPVLLLYPPVAKPGEPPAGLARLAMALSSRGHACRVYDANLEGMLHLLATPRPAADRWSRRAAGSVAAHLAALRGEAVYGHPDRYRRAVMDVNRVLQLAGEPAGIKVSLSDFHAPAFSPVRSQELLKAAETFETNPFYPHFRERLTALFAADPPAIVGISLNFMSQAVCGFAMAGFIKRVLPAARIVMGGGLVTSWMHLPGFEHPFRPLVDTLVSGPGEEALLAMCGPDNGTAASPGGFDYDLFPTGDYLAPGLILPYSASRGCFWRKCRFCPERSEKSRYAPTPPRTVQADLEYLVQRHRPRLIHFLDNALSPRLMKHLIAHPPGVPWYGFARITAHLADPDFAAALRRAGCVMLKLGIESGDPRVLEALEKGSDIATAARVLATLKAAGIGTYVYLLFGTPAETPESARRTLAFTRAHAGWIDFLNLAIFNLPLASSEARTLPTRAFYSGDLSLYQEFEHPAGWHRGRVRRFLAREFTRPAAIRRILHRNPPFFTSNHAPLLGEGPV